MRQDRTLLFTFTLVYFALLYAGGKNMVVAFSVPHDAATAAGFVTQHSGAIRLGSFLELISALPLALFMAAVVSRLRMAEGSASGEKLATLGAIATPLMLVGSALASWSLTRPGVAASGGIAVFQSLAFDGGGPGFAVFLGFFAAGVSLAAGLRKQLPGWLLWMGVVVAAAGELSSLTLLKFTAGYFIPVARFLSIVWMLCLALKLEKRTLTPGGPRTSEL